MAGTTKYPGADITTQWFSRRPTGEERPTMAAIDKLLLHTTESSGWPSYPSFFPNLTFNPWRPRGQRWRQHCNVNQASTTLKNAAGGDYQTNRKNVCQIEIVAWVDPNHSDAAAYYTKISEDAYLDLAEFYAWLNREWGTPISNTLQWKEYRHTPPSSYGVNNGVRLSTSAFTAYKGLCGHMHAPDQSHGDPSLINVGLIVEKAKALTEASSYPTPKTNDVYLSKIKLGQTDSDSVWQVQNALRKLGYPAPLTGDFDVKTLELRVHQLFDQAGIDVDIINDL